MTITDAALDQGRAGAGAEFCKTSAAEFIYYMETMCGRVHLLYGDNVRPITDVNADTRQGLGFRVFEVSGLEFEI